MSKLTMCTRFGWIVGFAALPAGFVPLAAGQTTAASPATAETEPPATQPGEAAETQPIETADTEAGPSSAPSPFKRPFKDWFHLEYLDADLQFESQYDWRSVKFPITDPYTRVRQQNQTNRLWHFAETIGIEAAGDVGSPEYIGYNMALRLGTDQNLAREKSPFYNMHDDGAGWLSEYDINLGLLKGKPIHFDVYTSLMHERVDRLFLPSLWHGASRTGVTMFREDVKFPMELTFETTRDNYVGDIDRFDDELVEETHLRYGGTFNFTPNHQFRLDYQYTDRHERYFGSQTRFDTTQNVLRLDDQVRFGRQHQHLWQNTLEYEADAGDLPRDHLFYASRLALQHSEKLTTEYKYEYSHDELDDITLESNRFDWLGIYKPKQGLATTSNLYAGHDSTDEGLSSNLFGGLLRVSGTRENRYGTLSATAGYHYDYTDSDFRDRSGTQINETVTFRNGLPSFLAHSDIEVQTILVTDLNRTTLFLPGRDYLVFKNGRYTGLVRMPFGRIAENQPVRVSYRYRTIRSGRFQTHELSGRIQQDFKSGWTPYYEAIVRRQSIDTNDTFFLEENDVDRHRLGVSYRKPTWLVGSEVEYNDDTVDPYTAVHLSGNWTIFERVIDRLAVRGGVSKFWFRRDEDERRPIIFDIAADYRRRISNRIDWVSAAIYRHEHDSVFGDTNGVDVRSGLVYRIGKLTVSADLEYDMLDIDQSEEDGLGLWLKVRREFPNLLARNR